MFDSKMQPTLQNHRYVDKNIHETIERIQSYEIHQKKLFKIREDLERRKMKKVNGDTSYEHLKSQMNNNKLRSHEFTETGISLYQSQNINAFLEKINEIKKSNQILLEKLLDISKGKRVSKFSKINQQLIQCEVKQENIQTTLPQGGKSLNYQVKKKEAERIDHENQKIMERIVNQNASLSSKKMHQDYVEQLRYKKMKEQKLGLSIDKILEKKRKMVLEARSTILPLLNTKLNSPGGTEQHMGRNFNLGGSIDAHSQRVINNNQSEDGMLQVNANNTYNNNKHQASSALNSNNRYVNKSQLTTHQCHSVTPKSQRQKRLIARSELSEYRDIPSKNSNVSQSYYQKKPNKIVLESITQKQPTNAKINSSLQLQQNKQNKPPVAPTTINKQEYTLQTTASTKLQDMPPVKTSSLSKSFSNNKQSQQLTQTNAKSHPLQINYKTTAQTINNKQKNSANSSITGIKQDQSEKSQQQSNKSTSSIQQQLQQQQTPKVQMISPLTQQKTNTDDTILEQKTLKGKNDIQLDEQHIIEEDEILDQVASNRVGNINNQKQKLHRANNDDIDSEVEDDYEEDKLSNNKQEQDTSQIQPLLSQKTTSNYKQADTSQLKQGNQSYLDDSKQYLERNSILSDVNNNSQIINNSRVAIVVQQNDIDNGDDEQYEEEFEEELID